MSLKIRKLNSKNERKIKTHRPWSFNSLVPETKMAEFANSVDFDEVAHNEPPHLDLHVCPLVFEFSI